MSRSRTTAPRGRRSPGSPTCGCRCSRCRTRDPSCRRRSTRPGWSVCAPVASERGFDRLLVIYADREHSANLAWLTGFDPRFEEALRRRGAHGHAARSSSATSAGAWPAPRRCPWSASCSRTSACRASRGTDRGRWPRSCGDAGSGAAAGSASSAGRPLADDAGPRRPGVPRRRAPPADRSDGRGRRTPPDLLIDAADRPARRSTSPRQLVAMEAASCRTSQGVRRPDRSAWSPGSRSSEAVALLDWNGCPAVLPPDADGRSPCHARAPEPERPADPARRPVHRRVRRSGARSTVGPGSSWPTRRSCRRGRRLRRDASSGRTSRRSPSGTRRFTSASRRPPSTGSSSAASATRSSACSSIRATRSGSTNG